MPIKYFVSPLSSAAGPQASFARKSCLSWEKWRKLNLSTCCSRVYCAPPRWVSASVFLVFVPLDWKVKVKVLVAQFYLHFCDPMDSSQQGSSVHGILQARILEWVVVLFSRGSSRPRDQTGVSGRFLTNWTMTGLSDLFSSCSWHILLNCFPQRKCTSAASHGAGVPVSALSPPECVQMAAGAAAGMRGSSPVKGDTRLHRAGLDNSQRHRANSHLA